jgi:hypothetical protein
MKHHWLTTLFPGVLAAVLLTSCGKSPQGPEITMADLETTNAVPPAASVTRFVAKPGSKVRIDGTANMIHTKWQVEGQLIGGYLEAGPNFPCAPGQAVSTGKVDVKAEVFIVIR